MDDTIIRKNLIGNPDDDGPTSALGAAIVYASCRCGGDKAWCIAVDGTQIMLGCICHTDVGAILREKLLS